MTYYGLTHTEARHGTRADSREGASDALIGLAIVTVLVLLLAASVTSFVVVAISGAIPIGSRALVLACLFVSLLSVAHRVRFFLRRDPSSYQRFLHWQRRAIEEPGVADRMGAARAARNAPPLPPFTP